MTKKVLVCDDQELVREVLAGFLKRKGYDVVKVSSGAECLTSIKSGDFDTLFLDVNMPGMNGFFVMREINKLKLDIRVVLMSGTEKSNFQTTDENLKNTPFLAKPFSLDTVLRVMTSDEKQRSKILVVDDQDMLREMLKDYLDDRGYDILEARDGAECITRLDTDQFDAIFMDVRMPVMDGLEALKQIRQKGITSPVFLMSGFGDVETLEDAVSRGAQNFLPKPFKLENALSMLNTLNI